MMHLWKRFKSHRKCVVSSAFEAFSQTNGDIFTDEELSTDEEQEVSENSNSFDQVFVTIDPGQCSRITLIPFTPINVELPHHFISYKTLIYYLEIQSTFGKSGLIKNQRLLYSF